MLKYNYKYKIIIIIITFFITTTLFFTIIFLFTFTKAINPRVKKTRKILIKELSNLGFIFNVFIKRIIIIKTIRVFVKNHFYINFKT